MKFKILKIILLLEIILFVFFVFNTVIEINKKKNTDYSCAFSEQEINDFNQWWESYTHWEYHRGRNRSAKEISTMIMSVIAHNVAETNSGGGRIITINNVKPATVPIIPNTTTYTVTAKYDKYGFITNLDTNPFITILEDSKGGE